MEVDEVIRTRRRGFHQGQRAVFPHQQVGYTSAACPPRAENLSSSQGADHICNTPEAGCALQKASHVNF